MQYLGVLSHSGSRGLGAGIGERYTKLAKNVCQRPGEARHLVGLGLDTEAGQEYRAVMTLTGAYASACHEQNHHHNFAWKEQLADGRAVITHRKGATPAGAGVLGIISGSMTAPTFIVRGRNGAGSLASASYGAVRLMPRTRAKAGLGAGAQVPRRPRHRAHRRRAR